MAHYDDIILPLGMSLGSSIGPKTSTQQLITTSGKRKTNKRFVQHLTKFDIGYNVKSMLDIYIIKDIYKAVDGPFGSFLARPWDDWNTTFGLMEPGDESFITDVDEPLQNTVTGLLTGDGSTTTFQMVKEYKGGSATANHRRNITKPQSGSTVVAVDAVPQTLGVDFTINSATGVITFISGAPANATLPTHGTSFYEPVGFMDDELLQTLDFSNHEVSIILQTVRL